MTLTRPRGAARRAAHGLAAAILLCLAMPAATAANPGGSTEPAALPDEVFSADELAAGKHIARGDCQAMPDAVWVEHAQGSECLRYFASSNALGAPVAALFFHGDRLQGRTPITSAYRDNSARKLRALAEGLAKVNAVPYVFVARPGTYGSSGRHSERRRLKEHLSLNAAVDAIKARLGVQRVHLGGQSGGAAVVAALLTLGRDDVVCAVASSGPYDAVARADAIALQTGSTRRGCDTTGFCDPYNITNHVDSVVPSAQRRVFLIGDPGDSNTPFKFQQAFATKLRAAGHATLLVEGQGTGPQRHGLTHMANRVLGWCHAGWSDERVAAAVGHNTPALHAPAQAQPEADGP